MAPLMRCFFAYGLPFASHRLIRLEKTCPAFSSMASCTDSTTCGGPEFENLGSFCGECIKKGRRCQKPTTSSYTPWHSTTALAELVGARVVVWLEFREIELCFQCTSLYWAFSPWPKML